MDVHNNYYSNLFSCGKIDSDAQRDLFAYVTLRLTESEQASCEGPLTFTEESEALCLSNCNKSLGPDGITMEFYAFF